MDGWVCYDQGGPSASGGMGLSTGNAFTESAALLASVAQQGLVRLRD